MVNKTLKKNPNFSMKSAFGVPGGSSGLSDAIMAQLATITRRIKASKPGHMTNRMISLRQPFADEQPHGLTLSCTSSLSSSDCLSDISLAFGQSLAFFWSVTFCKRYKKGEHICV